jgi:DNA-binding response OmpR family regulator
MGAWASVLVVDADSATRGRITTGLRTAGCSVRSVSSAVGGLAEVLCQPFDMLLLDLQMPGVGGLDVLPYLRRCAPDTPIVAMCDGDGQDDRAMQGGVQCVLHKPVDLQIAVGLVRLASRRPRPRTPPRPAWEGGAA